MIIRIKRTNQNSIDGLQGPGVWSHPKMFENAYKIMIVSKKKDQGMRFGIDRVCFTTAKSKSSDLDNSEVKHEAIYDVAGSMT